MTPEEFIDRLSGVRETSDPRWRWSARCPGHDDNDPSLSVGVGDDGWIILHCHAGCERESILVALGLTVDDLSTRPRPSRRIILDDEGPGPTAESRGCTVARLAEFKGLPVDFLRDLGLVDITIFGQPATRIPFCDVQGTEQSVLHRLNLTSDPKLRWKPGSHQMLYGLPWLAEARAAGQIVVVEGPSDAWTLRYHNIPVIGLPSAGKWDEEWIAYFDGIDTIFAVIERDQGGALVKRNLGRSALRDRVRFVDLGAVHKDASALYLADREQFRARFQAALAAAIAWQQAANALAQAETEAAWRQCEGLAREPDILTRFAQDLRRHGIAGEERFAQLIYLATTSRLQERPVSIAAKGPSAAGKSFVLQKVLEFFPTRAYYPLSAMSERALVYSQEPMQHRVMVVYEAQGLAGEWASYLMRSLLSENRIRYETVVKSEAGLEAKLVEREGPTGLLTTTTKILLHAENETRMLSVPADDSPAQTQRVLRQLARATASPAVDFGPWHALQTWLQGAEHRVCIPYADALAELVPPVAVRLRRDFGMLLSFIRAHATLHQATREKDATGQIVATLADYAAIRDLVADLLAEGIEASVSPTVRATVEAVAALIAGAAGRTATVKQVAERLGIDSPAALRRVKMALERGLLKNDAPERKRGQAYTLILGDQLPEDRVILPNADDPRLAASGASPGAEAPTEEPVSSQAPEQEETSWVADAVLPEPEPGTPAEGDPEWPEQFTVSADPEFAGLVSGNGNGNGKGDVAPDSPLWTTLQPADHPRLGWEQRVQESVLERLRRARPRR